MDYVYREIVRSLTATCELHRSHGTIKRVKNMKVLIVDDDMLNCLCLKLLIPWRSIGCEDPMTANNGAEALAIVENKRPDIVITDVKMPVMDGKELCRSIYEKYPEISVFFVSAYGDFETAQLAIRYNVKGYVLKPLDQNALLSIQEMICEVVSKKEYVSFCQKIAAGDYRTVLQTALEERDEEVISNFFDKINSIPDHFIEKDASFWSNLILPIIYYKTTSMKMDYSMLLQTERRMQEEIMRLPVEQRGSYIKGNYQELMLDVAEDNYLIWDIQEAVKENFSDPDLDVGVLAQRFNMSPAYLGRMFIEQTGMKLTDYIVEKRLTFACNELQNSRLSVKEIAGLAGYRDPGYFNKVFRRKMGVTPKEYRERNWRYKN